MAERTLYDRVLAAYCLDEDEDNPDAQPAISVGRSLDLGRREDSPRHTLEPSAKEQMMGANVNSIRVPFDPEDQSDDDVIITSVYERQTNTNKPSGSSNQSRHGKGLHNSHEKFSTAHQITSGSANSFTDAAHNGSSSGLNSLRKSLSPTAPPFQPKFSSSWPSAPTLVEIAGEKGMGRDDATCGVAYPGKRVPFCPWLIVTNYHSWFVGKQNSERIRSYFQTEALLNCQTWDFCYLWHPAKEKEDRYALVVPTGQFQHLLDRINQTLNIQLTIPPGANGEKFAVFFGQQKTPVPRFLGHASDAQTFDSLIKTMPPLNLADAIFEKAGFKNQAKEMYLKKINSLSHQHDKGRDKKNKSEKARRRRILDRRAWGKQIKRVQRYLGLREKLSGGPFQDDTPASISHALNLTKLMPYAQESDVLFVSMDIESYEYNHGVVTEVGFGILDTRDIAGVPPGLRCENWHALIRGRHFRIREHATMVNRNYIRGCEDNFNFGPTEFVGIKDILAVMTHILQPRSVNGELRRVVLVGHDIKSDISFVENVGFYVTDGMFLEIVDTQDFHQHFRMRSQQASLKGVLNDLEIEHYFLHNGGNDAVYTLQAMVSLVVNKRQDSLRRQNERLRPDYKPDEEIAEQGWDSGGEMTDGSHPKQTDRFDYDEVPGGPATPYASPSTSTNVTPRKDAAHDAPQPSTAWSVSSTAMEDGSEDLIKL